MLDINLFREDKGGNPELIRESQRRRFKDVSLVDQVIELDTKWRTLRTKQDFLSRSLNIVSKAVGQKMKAKEAQGDSEEIPEAIANDLENLTKEAAEALQTSQLRVLSKLIKDTIEKRRIETDETEKLRNSTITRIGNIVHETSCVSDNEDNNGIERLVGDHRKEEGLYNHVDLMLMLDAIDTERGSAVAGNRGYYVKGDLFRMALAVTNFGVSFLSNRSYEPLYTPFFMRQEIMAEVAQLEQFDDELYKVSGEGEDKYLIATSEQTVAALHRNEWLNPKALPIRYCGYSTCFRKEVGSHGRDTLGIFRVHQFEKVEQFCITSPKDNISWEMMTEMITNAEEFYKALNLSYRVVNIVSGALNNAAAKKFDLEGWFPGSNTYRELVSCSNCTDYQSRRLEIRYGAATKTSAVGEKEYCHMLNSTLCAVTRVLCCICETYQTKEGINVPEVLQPFMGGTKFIPFKKTIEEVRAKDAKAAGKDEQVTNKVEKLTV